jgi:hypothetical protein
MEKTSGFCRKIRMRAVDFYGAGLIFMAIPPSWA